MTRSIRETTMAFGRLAASAALCAFSVVTTLHAAPRVVLISLDGATPRARATQFMRDGTLPARPRARAARARGRRRRSATSRSTRRSPRPAHIAIATGSTAARNDIPANTFHLVASPFTATISGFGAPIGGYTYHAPRTRGSPRADRRAAVARAARRQARSVVDGHLPRRRRRRRPRPRARPAARSSSRRRSAPWTTPCPSAPSAASARRASR